MDNIDINEMLLFISDTTVSFEKTIYKVISKWSETRKKDDPLMNLPHAQAVAALIVHRLKSCDLLSFAKTMGISKSSASQLIQRLVTRGVVIRQQDPKNRRKVLIEIEPAVKDVLVEIDEYIQKWMRDVAKELGEHKVQQWYRIMKNLSKILNADMESEK